MIDIFKNCFEIVAYLVAACFGISGGMWVFSAVWSNAVNRFMSPK